MDNNLEIVLTAKDITGKAFDKINTRLKGLTKSVFSFNGAIVGAAGVAGLGYFVKKNLEAADAIAKTADTIGVTTRSLQEYRFVAERSGVATAQLDQGLGAFSKRLGELKSGTGALNTMLSKNNEALRQQLIATSSTDEALELFLDTLGKIENQSEKTALSAAAFSRTAGIKMTNLVKGGTASLHAMRKEFSDLGLVIDEKFLRQSELAVDQFTNLEYVLKTRLIGTVVKLAPEITKLVGGMTDWVTANDNFLRQDVPAHLRSIGNGLGFVVAQMASLVNATAYAGEWWAKFFYDPLKEGNGELRELQGELDAVNVKLKAFKNQGRSGSNEAIALEKERNGIKELIKLQEKWNETTRQVVNQQNQAAQSIENHSDKLNKTTKEIGGLIKVNDTLASSFKGLSEYVSGNSKGLQSAIQKIKTYEMAQLEAINITPGMVFDTPLEAYIDDFKKAFNYDTNSGSTIQEESENVDRHFGGSGRGECISDVQGQAA